MTTADFQSIMKKVRKTANQDQMPSSRVHSNVVLRSARNQASHGEIKDLLDDSNVFFLIDRRVVKKKKLLRLREFLKFARDTLAKIESGTLALNTPKLDLFSNV